MKKYQNLMIGTFSAMFKVKNITTRLLFFYNLTATANLLYLFINSFNKAIIYEDSFILLKPPELNSINWFTKPSPPLIKK